MRTAQPLCNHPMSPIPRTCCNFSLEEEGCLDLEVMLRALFFYFLFFGIVALWFLFFFYFFYFWVILRRRSFKN